MSKKKYSYNALITVLLLTLMITLSGVTPVKANDQSTGVSIVLTQTVRNQSRSAKKQYKNYLKSVKADYRSAVKVANSSYQSILKSTSDKNTRKQGRAAREKAIQDAQNKFDLAKKEALANKNLLKLG